MQKTKKQLLGLAGLAIVAVMTAIAIALPAPDAAAANNVCSDPNDPTCTMAAYDGPDSGSCNGEECPSAQGGAEINVRVGEGNVAVSIVTPKDGAQFVSPVIPVNINYSLAKSVTFTLSYRNANGTTTVKTVGPFDLNGEAIGETYQTNIDLSQIEGLGEYGYYTLKATVEGAVANTPREDTVELYYGAFTVTNNGETDSKDNPYLEIALGENVEKLQIQVYDRDSALFVNKEGEPTPVLLDRDDINPETGEIKVALPFSDYDIMAGKYTAVTIAYNTSGNAIATVRTNVDYKVETPDTPNTGMLLDGLNISRIDYLLTGLIAFGAVAGFAIYLICRKNRR